MLARKLRDLLWHAWLLLDYGFAGVMIRLFNKDGVRRRSLSIANASRIARRFMKAFHITLRVEGVQHLEALRDKNYLLVANHSTYVDILLLAAQENLVFITSVEMGNNFFLGQLTRLGGCLYTERRKKVSLPAEIKRFAATLRQGFKVALFPEGTSTDGSTIREFRRSLFQVAVDAQCPVLPVCIRYLSLDGQPIGDNNRDRIAWYGDMTFLPHHWKLLGHSIEARVSFLEPIAFDPSRTRSELADLVRGRLLESFHAGEHPANHIDKEK